MIGSGGAGLVAACVAADRSARVLVLEATDLLGGTTALSGGQLWIPGTPVWAIVGTAARAHRRDGQQRSQLRISPSRNPLTSTESRTGLSADALRARQQMRSLWACLTHQVAPGRVRWAGLVSGGTTLQLYFADWTGGRANRLSERRRPGRPPAGQRHSRTRRRRDAANRAGCTLLRLYCQNLRENSIHAYARDALEFGQFSDTRGIGVLDVHRRSLSPFANTASPTACHAGRGRGTLSSFGRYSPTSTRQDSATACLGLRSGAGQYHSQDTTHGDGRPSTVTCAMACPAQHRLWWRAALRRAGQLLSWSIDRPERVRRRPRHVLLLRSRDHMRTHPTTQLLRGDHPDTHINWCSARSCPSSTRSPADTASAYRGGRTILTLPSRRIAKTGREHLSKGALFPWPTPVT